MDATIVGGICLTKPKTLLESWRKESLPMPSAIGVQSGISKPRENEEEEAQSFTALFRISRPKLIFVDQLKKLVEDKL